MRLIDADAYTQEINNRIEAAIKWGTNAIADRNEEIKTRAEQAIATFCEASLTAKKMPTIDAEPIRHGEWITVTDGIFADRHYCSACMNYAEVDLYGKEILSKYCLNCGAHMDKGDT